MVADIERALEDVVTTARAHLAAVRAFGVDAATTLAAYDACADAAAAYERMLNEQFDESAPWSPELDDDEAPALSAVDDTDIASDEAWLAVRVRADYFVEDEDALF